MRRDHRPQPPYYTLTTIWNIQPKVRRYSTFTLPSSFPNVYIAKWMYLKRREIRKKRNSSAQSWRGPDNMGNSYKPYTTTLIHTFSEFQCCIFLALDIVCSRQMIILRLLTIYNFKSPIYTNIKKLKKQRRGRDWKSFNHLQILAVLKLLFNLGANQVGTRKSVWDIMGNDGASANGMYRILIIQLKMIFIKKLL